MTEPWGDIDPELEQLAEQFARVVREDEATGKPYLSREAAGKLLEILRQIQERLFPT